jgi:capsular polysaccharide transport system permease protein
MSSESITSPPSGEPSSVDKSQLCAGDEFREPKLSIFVLTRIVTMPFRFLRKNKAFDSGTSSTARERAMAPHITHLELRELDGGSGSPPRRRIPRSFIVIVALPTLLSFAYFGFIASDQYESHADFVIKTQGGGSSSPSGLASIMGAIGVGGHGSDSMATGDTAMVQAYVGSAQILKDLSADLDLRAMYDSREIDPISRLRKHPDFFGSLSGKTSRRTTSNSISDEELLKYWIEKVKVKPSEEAPGTSTLSVLAFTPEDAKKIADRVITLSEQLVNKVSERAQQDAVMYAQKEVDLAHDRAIKAFDDLRIFQEKAKQVDPAGFAKARSEIQGKMEQDLATLESQMEVLRKVLPEEAPGIQQLRSQVVALEEQLAVQKNRSTTVDHGRSATEVINEFAKLQMETDFASKDYLSALTTLESARIQANQQSRYLEAFDKPNLPDKPTFPLRWYDIISVLAVSLLIWGVWSLFIAGVKEHQH